MVGNADRSGGAGAQSGSLDLFNSFNAFNGMGSYFEGFQAGYNYMTPSRWLFGVEADVSFPSTITGTSTLSSATTGTASYAETVEFSGTLRGRIGYAPNLGTTHWLFYATGGFAWSFDQFTRTQIAGLPAGGTAVPGQTENLFLVPRTGGVAGAGVELALPSNWSARLEYLFTDYGNRSVTFPAGAQRFNSDLNVSELRFGLNYKLSGDRELGQHRHRAAGAGVRQFRRPRPDNLSQSICFSVPQSLFRAEQPRSEPRPRDLGHHGAISACGCGRARSSGSIRRSIKVSA